MQYWVFKPATGLCFKPHVSCKQRSSAGMLTYPCILILCGSAAGYKCALQMCVKIPRVSCKVATEIVPSTSGPNWICNLGVHEAENDKEDALHEIPKVTYAI